jgi:hypothetical protein
MAAPTAAAAAASVVPLVRRFAGGLRLRARAGAPPPTLASLEADVLASRILFLGETHHEPDVLRFQLAVLDLAAKHGPVHLVLEPFALPQQPLLDSFFASPSSPSQDAFAAEYEALGGLEEGFDAAVHYRALLAFLRDHHAGGFGCAALHHRAFAGFPARPEARRFVGAPEGLAGPVEEAVARGWVDAELQRRGLVVESSRAHRMFFAWLLRGGGPEESDPPSSTEDLSDRAARIFPAQVFKDSVMATQVVRALRALEEAEEKAGTEAPRRPGRVVAVCGTGHCDFGLGVPERVDAILRGAARHADGGKKTEPPRTLLLTVRARGPRGETGEAAGPVVPVTFPGGAEGVAEEEVRFAGDYVYDFVPAEEEEEEAGVR